MTGSIMSTSTIPELLASPDVVERFAEHVKETCVRPFPPLYFAVGIVEEVAELANELDKEGREMELLSELGDVLWFVYALCNSLQEVNPVLPSEQEQQLRSVNNPGDRKTDPAALLAAVGELCGSLKKWSRGDKGWSEFKDRIQRQISQLLLIVSQLGHVEKAMEKNIVKIKARKEKGTLRGDGSNR